MAQIPFPFWLARLVAAITLLAPLSAHADPADINAAARGVVRIVVIEQSGEELRPLSHGTGFAISPERVVTNSHVIREALADDGLSIGIVPSDGENAVYARVVATSPRNDLALLATTSVMNLPPLTIANTMPGEGGSVTSVGYPMNVERAQGLSMDDVFRAQPPVKSTGFLAGRRPTRDFDSLLHTAPIARGNSGGPLLDDCGRVVGVNSFGAESGGADAEFYFAISNRELLPFLRANDITPQVNGLPCRSIDDLEAEEAQRAERERLAARDKAEAEEAALARRREEMRRQVEFEVFEERDYLFALSLVLLIGGLGSGFYLLRLYDDDRFHGAPMKAALGGAVLLLAGSVIAFASRPGYSQVEDRLQDRLREEMEASDSGTIKDASTEGRFVCVLDQQRSRVTGAVTEDVPFTWTPDGCVNGRTQYGIDDGIWTRVLVPADEAVVTVNRYDPDTFQYRVERYLLGREELDRARGLRSAYQAPACGAGLEAAQDLGAQQTAILATLPEQPNERLVYDCRPQSE